MLTWSDLEARFQELERELQHSRIDGQGGTAGEYWRFAGQQSENVVARFEALSRIASDKLFSEHGKFVAQFQELEAEGDPLIRWYKAIRYIAKQWDSRLFGVQAVGGVTVGSIHAPAQASGTLCLRLSALQVEQTASAVGPETVASPSIIKRMSFFGLKAIGTVSLVLLGAWVLFWMGPNDQPAEASLRVEFQRYFGDYPVELSTWGTGGIIDSFWEVIITNEGNATTSVVRYEIRLSDKNGGFTLYGGLDKGLFDMELGALSLPITLEPGHAERFLVKAGIAIPQEVHKRLLKAFPSGKLSSIESAVRTLYRSGMDIHGLEVTSPGEGTFSFPKSKEAPTLVLSLQDLSGEYLIEAASWYPSSEG